MKEKERRKRIRRRERNFIVSVWWGNALPIKREIKTDKLVYEIDVKSDKQPHKEGIFNYKVRRAKNVGFLWGSECKLKKCRSKEQEGKKKKMMLCDDNFLLTFLCQEYSLWDIEVKKVSENASIRNSEIQNLFSTRWSHSQVLLMKSKCRSHSPSKFHHIMDL